MCDGGEWKTVCSNTWDNEEASVACRQIGFTGLSNCKLCISLPCKLATSPQCDLLLQLAVATRDLRFGGGVGGKIEASWECSGNEGQLLDCPKSNTSCNGDEVAGVLCFGWSYYASTQQQAVAKLYTMCVQG